MVNDTTSSRKELYVTLYFDGGMSDETMRGRTVMINGSILGEGVCFFITGWVIWFLHRSHAHGRARFNQTHTDGVESVGRD
jgi:hypothetical protein